MLDAQSLHKLFHAGSPDERTAIDNVSLQLQPGDFAVVVGGNGAGKSTLLNMVAGEVTPDSGFIRIGAEDVTPLATHQRARLVSRVFQDPSIGTAAALSIEENLAVADQRGARRGFGRALTPALAAEFRDRLATFGLGLEKRMGAQAGRRLHAGDAEAPRHQGFGDGATRAGPDVQDGGAGRQGGHEAFEPAGLGQAGPFGAQNRPTVGDVMPKEAA